MADRRIPRTLRRAYLRHRRLGAALCAGGAALALGHAVAPPPPDLTAVVVAARDLDGGAPLTRADVRVIRVPPVVAPRAAASTVDEATGRVLTAPMRAGEPITDRRVMGRSLVAGYPPGTVAAPIRIQDAGVVGLLAVGDRVDVYAATAAPAGRAAKLVSGARVLFLPPVGDQLSGGALVVLAVTSPDAARLAQASASTVLSLSVRG